MGWALPTGCENGAIIGFEIRSRSNIGMFATKKKVRVQLVAIRNSKNPRKPLEKNISQVGENLWTVVYQQSRCCR